MNMFHQLTFELTGEVPGVGPNEEPYSTEVMFRGLGGCIHLQGMHRVEHHVFFSEMMEQLLPPSVDGHFMPFTWSGRRIMVEQRNQHIPRYEEATQTPPGLSGSVFCTCVAHHAAYYWHDYIRYGELKLFKG